MKVYIAIIILIFLSSCSEYNRLLKSDAKELKYQKAIEYYEKGDYTRTIQLIESVTSFYRGSKEAAKLQYYYAYSHYHLGDYITAAYHFNNLATTFPNSEYAEEAFFMSAYSKYMDSPPYYLDQTSTKQAISEMQKFINKYPNSERVKKANEIIDELRAKLELKAFQSAKLLFHIEEYKAAIVAFNNLINDYPGTKFTEEAMFLTLKAWYLYAIGSVEAKKRERFLKVQEAYNNFVEEFPQSKYLTEAKNLYENSLRNIEKISRN